MHVLLRQCFSCLIVLTLLSIPARCESAPDEQILTSLEQRASQAPADEQCYLYAQLVHGMVQYSAGQYASGDADKATSMLKRTQQFAHKMRSMLTSHPKKIKDTQILLRRAAFRLRELLHYSSYENRRLVQETLSQVSQTQDEAMILVFQK